MIKDTDTLLKSIKDDLIECKQILGHFQTLITEGNEILSKF